MTRRGAQPKARYAEAVGAYVLGNIAALPGWKHPYDMMPGNPSDRA